MPTDTADTLQRLVDERDVTAIFVRYFDRVDADDAAGAAQLFALDARVEIMTGKVYEGRANFERALDRVLGQYLCTSHDVTNTQVVIEGNVAYARAHVYAYHRLRETGSPWHLWARIVDRLERQPDGRWLIQEHVLHGVDSNPRWGRIDDDWYRGHPGRRDRHR